jgi:GcrA cell cycle regulator
MTTSIASGWTEERVSTMKKLWLDGVSASEIAKQMGDVTRNAVIGKVHRLGLNDRATPSKPSRPAPTVSHRVRATSGNISNRAPEAKPRVPAKHILESKEIVLLTKRGLETSLTLSKYSCKWPIGDPTEDTFSFCGRKAEVNRPYCQGHTQFAYKPSTPKARASEDRGYHRFIAM